MKGWSVTLWSVAGLVAMVALIFVLLGWSEESLRVIVRSTARTSLGFFVLVFSASSLCRLWPASASRWILRNRRYLGVSFAVSHLFHADALIALAAYFPAPIRHETDLLTVVGGGLCYVFIFAMALTSSDRAQAWLGRKRWRQLHVVGSYFIWVIFAQSYFGRVLTDVSYFPHLAVIVGSLVLRLTPGVRDAIRRKRAPTAT